jgi:cytochrome c-type biogenesis protein CcmH
MIGLWLAIAVLTVLVMALVVFPLLRRGASGAPDRAAYDLTVYQDQLAEIDRDIERGLVPADHAEAARIEIKRRMLSAGATAPAPDQGQEPRPPSGRRSRRSPMLATVLAVMVPLVALGLYWDLGHPGGFQQPIVASGPDGQSLTMEEAVAQLQRRLDADPANLEGWLLLGRSYLSLGRPAEAVVAYRTAAALSGQRPDVIADYGEALVAADQGRVLPMANSLFKRALAADPSDTKARYYIALGKAQQGDLEGALQDWTDVLALSPADAPWVPAVREQVDRAAINLGVDPGSVRPSAEVQALASGGPAPGVASSPAPSPVPTPGVTPDGPGPTEEDVAAAEQMSGEDRAAMVRSMVDRLAARLEDDPDNLEGWLRLAGAYEVIGQPDKAREARARAEALLRQ